MEDAFNLEGLLDDETQSSQPLPLSQEPTGLSPPGSISDARLIRLPPGTYRERASSADSEVSHESSAVDAATSGCDASHDEHDGEQQEDDEDGRSPDEDGRATPTPTTPRRAAPHRQTEPTHHSPSSHSGIASSVHAPAPAATSVPAAVPSTHTGSTTRSNKATHTTTQTSAHRDSTPASDNEAAGPPDGPGVAADDTSPATGAAALPKHWLEGETLHRIRRPGHPHLAWRDVQAAAQAPNFPPTGNLESKLPGHVNCHSTLHVFSIQGAIMDAVHDRIKECAAPREFEVSLHSGRFKCVRVSFSTAELLTSALGLRVTIPSIDGHPPFVLDEFKMGTPLGARYVAVQLRHPGLSPHAAKKKLELAVREAEGVYLVEVWAVYHHSGPPSSVKSPANDLIALLVVMSPAGGTFASPLTEDELRSIPCYIGMLPLTFSGRFPQCRGCGCFAQLGGDFHTSTSCQNPTIPCAVCSRWGHCGVQCPRNPFNQTRNEDGNAAAADQEDAFEYEPAGPVPSTSTPEKRPSTSAPSVPVAGPSTPSSSNASRGAHQGRGRGRGASHGNRTHYQQAFLTPQGGVSRNPPPGSGPSTPKRNHKRPRSKSPDTTN
ncbi:unnamed protein product [Tilletia laevis]|nr:unnamed protein product [Tilletia laevis]